MDVTLFLPGYSRYRWAENNALVGILPNLVALCMGFLKVQCIPRVVFVRFLFVFRYVSLFRTLFYTNTSLHYVRNIWQGKPPLSTDVPEKSKKKQLQQPKEQGALLCTFFDVISSFFFFLFCLCSLKRCSRTMETCTKGVELSMRFNTPSRLRSIPQVHTRVWSRGCRIMAAQPLKNMCKFEYFFYW